MKNVLEVLQSSRFWSVVIIAFASYLKAAGLTWDPVAFATALEIVAGGHVAIRSWDRTAEFMGKKPRK